jgi:hypothetical protein
MAIQDKGKRFDLQKATSVDSPERRLGVAIMKEQTNLSGGSFAKQVAPVNFKFQGPI